MLSIDCYVFMSRGFVAEKLFQRRIIFSGMAAALVGV